MTERVITLPLKAYVAFTGFLRSIKDDERGLSGVVVAVLLILVAILAVVLIWGFLQGWIHDVWDRITGETQGLQP